MADIKLFRISPSKVQELQGKSATVEKSLQSQIESHMDEFLGIRFLASEYTTGRTHSGRIDTLGIDENGSPVVVEYKRTLNENVITQGLFYLDWLMDHKAEFVLLVVKQLGPKGLLTRSIGQALGCFALRAISISMMSTRCSKSIATLS